MRDPSTLDWQEGHRAAGPAGIIAQPAAAALHRTGRRASLWLAHGGKKGGPNPIRRVRCNLPVSVTHPAPKSYGGEWDGFAVAFCEISSAFCRRARDARYITAAGSIQSNWNSSCGGRAAHHLHAARALPFRVSAPTAVAVGLAAFHRSADRADSGHFETWDAPG